MDTLLSVLIASVVTFFFVRGYLKKLTEAKKAARTAPGAAPAAAANRGKVHPCPRCGKPIAEASVFCSHCGAALAMWSVHRAAVNTPAAGAAKGKPKPVINASLCIGCGACIEACPETGALELVGGKAILSHPDRCTGQAKCAEACPTQGILYSYDGALQTVRVPMVKDNFETNVPGLFIVGELGGMGLIKTAVNEGKLVMDHVQKRTGRAAAPPGHGQAEAARAAGGSDPDALHDVLIVGAGPAGLSAALTAHQYGLDYVALEQGEIASTIRHYPRHKFLMAEPIEIPLFGPLYVSDGTKETLLAVWETIVSNTGVRVQTNERVERVKRNGTGFVVDSSKGQYRAKNVILALGRRGTPRTLGAPGEELGKVAYSLIEAESYAGKQILVVGGGDSAIEAAVGLSKHKRNQVTLSYRGETFQRARERNQKFIAEAEAQGLLAVRRNSQVKEIRPNSVLLESAGQVAEVPNDYVFALIGGVSPEEFLQKTGVEIVEKALSVAGDRKFS